MRGPMGRLMFAAVMFVMIVTAATFGQMAIDQVEHSDDIEVQPPDAERPGVVDANDFEGEDVVVGNITQEERPGVIDANDVVVNNSS